MVAVATLIPLCSHVVAQGFLLEIPMPTTIAITANDDGSFTVEREPAQMAPEGPENSPQDMAEDMAEGEPSQQCASIDEALSVAAQMLGSAEPEKAMMPGEKEFAQGFKSARGM